MEATDLPAGFHLHDLRHTGNTWAASAGANLRELMERMGHDSERAALIYLHAASEGHRAMADEINRRLSGDGQEAAGSDREPGTRSGTDVARRPSTDQGSGGGDGSERGGDQG